MKHKIKPIKFGGHAARAVTLWKQFYRKKHCFDAILYHGHILAIGADVVDPHGYADLPAFRWNVCWYKQKLKGQTFPVVNYLVKK